MEAEQSVLDNQEINDKTEPRQDTMQQLLEQTREQLFYTRILTGAFFAMFLVVFISAVILVPKVCGALGQINNLTEAAGATLESANQALAEVSEMSTEITGVSTQLNEFITENAQTLSDAATDISEIDFEGLNQAIQDLQDAVGPFANLMNGFRR
ncbi:MAG: hypothetical protein J6K48_09125 [Lachnospiraceae bacterium]|nr:hypothetical protein [Lachnospiraceae bacterium]